MVQTDGNALGSLKQLQEFSLWNWPPIVHDMSEDLCNMMALTFLQIWGSTYFLVFHQYGWKGAHACYHTMWSIAALLHTPVIQALGV